MLYMFLLYWNEAAPVESSENVIAEHFAFTKEARARGAYVHSEALGGTAAATTVRVRNGKVQTVDGPYAETKEVMGGYYMLDCKDLDEALEYAAKIPDAKYGAVEVRPVFDVPDWDYGAQSRYERRPMG
jgi:hypothetical protein